MHLYSISTTVLSIPGQRGTQGWKAGMEPPNCIIKMALWAQHRLNCC